MKTMSNSMSKKKVYKEIFVLVICFIFALCLGAGTVYFLGDNFFYQEEEVARYQDFGNLGDTDYEFYQIKGNEFKVIAYNPCLFFKNVNQPCNRVEITISEIDNTAKESNGNLSVQLFWSDTSLFVAEKGISSIASPGNQKIVFAMDFDENTNFRVDIGENKGDQFQLKEISFIHRQLQPLSVLALAAGVFGLIYFALFYFYIRKKVKKMDSKRESNIEACRLVCMLLLIAHHCVLHGGAVNMEFGPNLVAAMFLIPGGKLCFDAFLAISCWFLVEQSFRTERFLKVWLEVLFYSVGFAVVASLFGMGPSNWFSVLLPITGNSHGFAASYLAFYLLLPFLGKMTKDITKKQGRWLLAIIFYFEVGAQIIGAINNYYQPLFSELLLFVLCYILALNLKRWPIRFQDNKKVLLMIFGGLWIGLWIVRCFAVVNPQNPVLAFIISISGNESSFINIIGGFALFFFFKNLKIPNVPMINFLATGTFGVLLIHDHNFFRYPLWGKLMRTPDWYYSNKFVLLVGMAVVIIFVVCFLIDTMRSEFLEKKIFRLKKVKDVCKKYDEILEGKPEK